MDFGYGMGWMWVFWLLLVVGLTLLVVVAVRALSGGLPRGGAGRDVDGAPSGRSRARRLLDERYARGEIATEEYRERLRALDEDA